MKFCIYGQILRSLGLQEGQNIKKLIFQKVNFFSRPPDRETERQRERERDRETDRQTDRPRDRETERQRDRETDRRMVCKAFNMGRVKALGGYIGHWSATGFMVLHSFQ